MMWTVPPFEGGAGLGLDLKWIRIGGRIGSKILPKDFQGANNVALLLFVFGLFVATSNITCPIKVLYQGPVFDPEIQNFLFAKAWIVLQKLSALGNRNAKQRLQFNLALIL